MSSQSTRPIVLVAAGVVGLGVVAAVAALCLRRGGSKEETPAPTPVSTPAPAPVPVPVPWRPRPAPGIPMPKILPSQSQSSPVQKPQPPTTTTAAAATTTPVTTATTTASAPVPVPVPAPVPVPTPAPAPAPAKSASSSSPPKMRQVKPTSPTNTTTTTTTGSSFRKDPTSPTALASSSSLPRSPSMKKEGTSSKGFAPTEAVPVAVASFPPPLSQLSSSNSFHVPNLTIVTDIPQPTFMNNVIMEISRNNAAEIVMKGVPISVKKDAILAYFSSLLAPTVVSPTAKEGGPKRRLSMSNHTCDAVFLPKNFRGTLFVKCSSPEAASRGLARASLIQQQLQAVASTSSTSPN